MEDDNLDYDPWNERDDYLADHGDDDPAVDAEVIVNEETGDPVDLKEVE